MGLKDRFLDTVAKWFSPSMDHPSGGGMTGEGEFDFEESDENAGDSATAEETIGDGTTGEHSNGENS